MIIDDKKNWRKKLIRHLWGVRLNDQKLSRGTSLIEVLIAVAVIVFLAVAITGLAMISTRILIQSENKVVALGIANEKLEEIRSAERSGTTGSFSGNETIVANGISYNVEVNAGGDTTVAVSWMAPGGVDKKVEAVTFVASGDPPLDCGGGCSGDTTCDQTIGICRPKEHSPSTNDSFGSSCRTGMLCPNGSICDTNRNCGLELDDVTVNTNCKPGDPCGGGAICPLTAVCPTNECSGGGACGGGTCFDGWCYEGEAFGLSFPSTDSTGPMSASPLICQGGGGASCATCKSGTTYYIQYGSKGWVPQCGGSVGCQGGFPSGGSSCPTDRSLVQGSCAGADAGDGRILCTGNQSECAVSGSGCPWPIDGGGAVIDDGSVVKQSSVFWGGFGDSGCLSYPVYGVVGPTNSSGEVVDPLSIVNGNPDTGTVIPDCSSGGGGGGGGGGIGIEMKRVGGPDLGSLYEIAEGSSTGGPKTFRFRFKLADVNIQDDVDANVELIEGIGDINLGQDVRITGCSGDACKALIAPHRQVLKWEPGDSDIVFIDILILNDDVPEQHESFDIGVTRGRSNYYQGVTKPALVKFILYNDDVELRVVGGSGSEDDAEAAGGTYGAELQVIRAGATTKAGDTSIMDDTTISFGYDFVDGTATSGLDYNAAGSSSSPRFLPSDVLYESISIPVSIYDDGEFESSEETFRFSFAGAVTTTHLIPKIMPILDSGVYDNELEIGLSTSGADEGEDADIEISASMGRGPADGSACVSYEVIDGTATSADHGVGGGTVCVDDGEWSGEPNLYTVNDDALVEGSECFEVRITGSSGADYWPWNDTRSICIGDNDLPPPPPT